jgi:DNA (cytosine-5)-methyltransferase 1
VRIGALCAGYGGMELGLQLVWPPLGDIETAWVAELDPHASQVLDARFGVPNLGDLTQITEPPPVDIVTAGFPCQPFSTAGLRKGTADERWLIDDVCRVASAAGARWLILENVTGLLTANDGDALARVCAAMASQGFSRWEWTTLRASDIGACHRRDRWFCVAHATDVGLERCRDTRRRGPRPANGDVAAADPDGQGLEGRGADTERRGERPTRACRLDARFGPYQPAVDRWAAIIGRPAPEPLTDGRLEPRFVEWMMGLPAGWVTDIVTSRAKALHVLGNGVVPQQAAAAIAELTR